MNLASIIIAGILLFLSVFCVALNSIMSANLASIIGGALGALATCALGLLAFWQNRQYKRLADEKNEQLERMMLTPECILIKAQPHDNVYQTSPILDVFMEESSTQAYCVLTIRTTNQPMIHLLVGEVLLREDGVGDDKKVIKYPRGSLASRRHEIEYLESNSEYRIGIQIPDSFSNAAVVCEVTLQYVSIYNYQYRKTLSFKYSPRSVNGYEIYPERVVVLPSAKAEKVECDNGTHEV